MQSSELTQSIMLRVWTVYWFRKLMRPYVLESFVLLGVIVIEVFALSINSIVNNFRAVNDVGGATNFMFRAFLETELYNQAFAVLLFAIFLIVSARASRDVFSKVRGTLFMFSS